MVERFQPRYELYMLLFPNGKRYIGISTDSIRRFYDHKCSKQKFQVHRAIKKHGAANIILSVVCMGRRDYIRQLEVACIAKFKTTDRAYGYNVTPGGELGPTPEMAERISKTKLGHLVSEETRAQISASLLRFFQDNPKEFSLEHRAKINKAIRSGKPRKASAPWTPAQQAYRRAMLRERNTSEWMRAKVKAYHARAVAA